ncbi:MAG: hypothetical protein E7402_02470 [Ruminococcaceae bacterium]|nr:hypothetical protein [Oscillospiraceae bacterium]
MWQQAKVCRLIPRGENHEEKMHCPSLHPLPASCLSACLRLCLHHCFRGKNADYGRDLSPSISADGQRLAGYPYRSGGHDPSPSEI